MLRFILIASIAMGARQAFATQTQSDVSAALRLDCLHNASGRRGAAQSCIEISGLRLSVQNKVSEDVKLTFAIDPFGTPIYSLEHAADTK